MQKAVVNPPLFFYFYGIIENVTFLENYIRKNIKAYVDSQNEIKWTKK